MRPKFPEEPVSCAALQPVVVKVLRGLLQLCGVAGEPGLRSTIPASKAMLPLPLLPKAEWVQALRPIDCKHAIQVIDLVLE
jgi:hypothetical protein